MNPYIAALLGFSVGMLVMRLIEMRMAKILLRRLLENPYSAGERRLMERLNSLSIITNLTLENTMTALDDLKAAETRREASDARIEGLLKSVSDQLAALIATNGDSVPAADLQAVVDAINAETDKVDAASDAATPQPPAAA